MTDDYNDDFEDEILQCFKNEPRETSPKASNSDVLLAAKSEVDGLPDSTKTPLPPPQKKTRSCNKRDNSRPNKSTTKNLPSSVSGIIKKMFASVGDQLLRGQEYAVIDATSVTCPFKGIVMEVHVKQGEKIDEGQTTISILETS